jgi:alkanesulfonate monooxygenase SsuD/methylene tetrahydromethanopterin reductase-like flavin-dependent oxidoreductase (luciferase family)
MPEHERLSSSFEELSRDRFIIGTPELCANEIRSYGEQLGVTHVLVRMQWPGMPHWDTMRQIELIGEHIIPLLTSMESRVVGE